MCLIALSWKPHSPQPLVLIANRDEFHSRPTAALDWWSDDPGLLAGRDLKQGGTWLGVHRRGAFAALTNFRQREDSPSGLSRGHLVSGFLQQNDSPMTYAQQLSKRCQDYAGFNLLVGDNEQLVYLSNRSTEPPRVLSPGVYGLSNALLDTAWPKLREVRDGLASELEQEQPSLERLMQLMQRREVYADEELPDTGVGLNMERMLSPPFICTPLYGTRCSTYIHWDRSSAEVLERSFTPAGEVSGEVTRNFAWSISESGS